MCSLKHFFLVAKGDHDIQMVYNGTSLGLNDTLWAPHFFLPTVQQELRAVKEGTYLADKDIEEMFLNFMLGESIRTYCGVDITQVWSNNPEDVEWEKERPRNREGWKQDMMGLVDLPFQAIQIILWLKEVVYVNPSNEKMLSGEKGWSSTSQEQKDTTPGNHGWLKSREMIA